MLRGDRNADFAVVGLILVVQALLGLALWASYPPSEQGYSYTREQCAIQKLEHANRQAASLNADEPITTDGSANQKEDAHNQQRDWCDLAAQESMAKSTVGMERATWLAAITGVFGLWLVFLTVVYAKRAASHTEQMLIEAKAATTIAQETLETSARPWLALHPSIASPLIFKDGEGRITIHFAVTNYGPSPAVHVEVIQEVALDMMDEFSIAAKLRERARRRSTNYELVGHKVFPNQTFTFKISIPIGKSEIEAYRSKIVSWGAPSDPIYIVPAIIACVVYDSPAGKKNHVTEFRAHIGLIDPENENSRLSIIPPENGRFEIDQLRFDVSFGTGVAD